MTTKQQEATEEQIAQATEELIDSFVDGDRCGFAGIEMVGENSPDVREWIEAAIGAGLSLQDAVKLVADHAWLELTVDARGMKKALREAKKATAAR